MYEKAHRHNQQRIAVPCKHTLQLFLRLPELLQFREVLVQDEYFGQAQRSHIRMSGQRSTLGHLSGIAQHFGASNVPDTQTARSRTLRCTGLSSAGHYLRPVHVTLGSVPAHLCTPVKSSRFRDIGGFFRLSCRRRLGFVYASLTSHHRSPMEIQWFRVSSLRTWCCPRRYFNCTLKLRIFISTLWLFRTLRLSACNYV